jgi:peptidoglycan/LPS O-acetylase OafA/YrhL
MCRLDERPIKPASRNRVDMILITEPCATQEQDAAPPRAVGRVPRRADIQWLRALAVTMVVVYHFWPTALPGGYVGVDVFFVISGFLITGGLISRPPGAWRDVLDFWARRIRRLLPAAFLVIAATWLAALAFAPASTWRQTARDGVAAAAYAENWNLWRKSTDYLAGDGLPSVFQHFWSLSIEEQFYVVWPLALWAAAAVVRRLKPALVPGTVLAVAGLATTASLVCSVWLTAGNPRAAYLVSPTRVWELSLGGILAASWRPLTRALIRPRLVWARLASRGAGLAAMVTAAFAFSGSTPFPGAAALLPTIGSALFIAAGSDGAPRISETPPPPRLCQEPGPAGR